VQMIDNEGFLTWQVFETKVVRRVVRGLQGTWVNSITWGDSCKFSV
jgi:hypothetical protein